jgi:hypothetical protein
MPRHPRFGFDRIRDFARTRVEATSLREVAKDIGMSFSGLHNFLEGGQPYTRVRELLVSWYQRSRDQTIPPPSREEVDAAITVLSQYLERTGTRRVSEQEIREVVERMRRAPGRH